MSENLVLNVRLSNASRFTIGSTDSSILTPSSTILQLKQLIAGASESGNCEVARQRIIYKGRILSDNSKSLREYGLAESDQTIHLVKGSAPAPTPSPNATSSTNSTPTGTTNSPSSNPNPTMPNMNPFMSMMQGNNNNNNNNNGGMFPDMSQMQQMQQQAMQNPEMMNSIMNSPMMQSMMSNPELIRTMMESNPQMRQLLETNPELRHMLDDPELMRRSMEMMRDPNAMRNAMRNNDLAMSQIENIPGGFSALRRMYEDVQEPMMDAMASGNTDTSTGSSPSSSTTPSGSGAAGTAMPNPWGAPTTGNTSGQSTTSTSGANTSNLFGNNAGGFNPWGASATGGNGMPGMPPNMNLESTLSMLENPMISQMMDQMMSNPAMMQSMMDSNPMIRQMREANPEMAAMMTNPETMRQMMNPSNLRAMVQMQNAMQQLGQSIPGLPATGMPPMGSMGGSTNNPSSVPGSTPTTTPAPGVMDFTSLFNQLQNTSISGGTGVGGVGTSSTPTSSVAPEQRYRMQLQSLNDMGFDNNETNIRALTQTHGNVNRAVDLLFTDPLFQSTTASTPAPAANASSNLDSTTNESSASSAPVEENIGGTAGEDNARPSDKKND